MPYSKPSDAPDHVPADKKAQWVEIFNSAYKAAKKAGMSDKDAEGKAFAEANGVIKKESKAMSKFERSFLSLETTEFRVEKEGDKSFITGYAAVYDQPTDKVGMGMREVVKKGAFDRALKEKQDVRALYNHNPSDILGRTKAGTLTLSSDAKGLKYRIEMPNTTMGRDVMESVKRGDISQSSFGFRVKRQAWVQSADPNDKDKVIMTREIHDVDLGDVSPVTYPAYDGTSVGASRAEFRAIAFPEGIPEDIEEHLKEERAVKFLVTEADGKTHLPVTGEDGKPDHHLMGAAWAALHGGYRGKKYAGPNKDEAIKKLEAMYKSEGQPTPTEQKSDNEFDEQRARMKMRIALSESLGN
jgi:HK97 family phage prohead protease